MAGFIEEILSGKYPKLENLWRGEFSRVVDEVFGTPDPDLLVDDIDDDFDAPDDVQRLEKRLKEEQESHKKTLDALRLAWADRDALQSKIDALRRELLT